MEIALHPPVTQILACAARLTPDHAQRRWALAQAAIVGEHLVFHDANQTGKAAPGASRVGSCTPRRRKRS